MMDRKIVRRTKAGRICNECRKGDRKCLWPEASSRTKACHSCSALKVRCVVAGEESSEAGPSKKRKVATDKGKGKAKEVKKTKSEPEFRFQELVEELPGFEAGFEGAPDGLLEHASRCRSDCQPDSGHGE